MTFLNNMTLPNNFDAQSNGRASSNPFVVAFMPRDPTVHDVNYPQQKLWLNTVSENFWFLETFNTIGTGGEVQAIWIPLSSAAVTETLTGNDGIVVPPTGNNINVLGDVTNILTSGNAGTSTLTISLNGNVATTYVEDTGSATPSAHILNVLGTGGIATSGSGNTITIDGSGVVVSDLKFNVDADTAPGTNPVVPDASGHVTITGAQVAAGTTTNVIRTDSLAANTYTIEVQRSQAVGSSTVGDNGVSHFDSSIFSVDSNAFVSLSTSFYQTAAWTPTLQFGGASTGITYTKREGQYTRIGNVVFFSFNIILSSKGSSTGVAQVIGLPISAGVELSEYQNEGSLAGGSLDAGANQLQGVIIASTSAVLLFETTPSVSQQTNDTNFTNVSSFGVTGLYFT